MIRKLVLIGIAASLAAPLGAAEQEAPEMARIITMNGQPAQCLSRVHIQFIDGERVNVHNTGFDLEPGTHSLNGRAILDTTFCRPIHGRVSEDVPDLVADFEAGRTYYIGLDHRSRNFNEWRLVIWKVEPEETEQG